MAEHLNINQSELMILAHMHENVKGFGPYFKMDPSQMSKSLEMQSDQFSKCISYLAEHKLAGINAVDNSGFDNGADGSHAMLSVFLTGFGEDYMRALESKPCVARRLTTKAVEEMWGVIKDVAAQTLASMLTPTK